MHYKKKKNYYAKVKKPIYIRFFARNLKKKTMIYEYYITLDNLQNIRFNFISNYSLESKT